MAYFVGGKSYGDPAPDPYAAYAAAAKSTASSGAPNLVNLRDQLMGNLSGALKGELPSDVQDLIKSRAAEFGVASGMPGSELAGNQGLRTLGLTSLNRMQGAENLLAPYAFDRGGPSYSYARPNSPDSQLTQPKDPWFSGPIPRGPSGSAPLQTPRQSPITPIQGGGGGAGSNMNAADLLKFLGPMGSGTQPTYDSWLNSIGGGNAAPQNDFASMIPFFGGQPDYQGPTSDDVAWSDFINSEYGSV